MVDKLKFVLAIALVVAGLAGYYLLSDQVMVVRVLCVIGGLVAGGVVARFSEPGRRFQVFVRAAIVETKKVVWPTRKETVQMTLTVFVFVVVMAIFLWLGDLGWNAVIQAIVK